MELLTDKQCDRLDAVFGDDAHAALNVTWGVYQNMIKIINATITGVPAALPAIRRLGRTLKRRAADILACFDRPGTSNGPAEAINGRLEHLRGSALGFRYLINYIARSLLGASGFRPQLHP